MYYNTIIYTKLCFIILFTDISCIGSVPDGKPRGTTLTSVNSTCVRVSWQRSELSDVIGYYLKYGQSSPETSVTVMDVNTTQHLVAELKPNTKYIFLLSLLNKNGNGDFVFREITTLKKMPKQVFVPMALKAVQVKSNSIEMNWKDDNPVELFRNYTIGVKNDNSEQENSEILYTAVNRKHYVIRNLQPSMDYAVRIRVTINMRSAAVPLFTSDWSMLLEVRTLETAPADSPSHFSATATSPTRVRISWQRPLKPNGVLRGYTLYYTTDVTKSWIEDSSVDPGELNYYVEKLSPGATYYFKMSARNAKGSGPKCKAVSVILPTVLVTPGTEKEANGNQMSIFEDTRLLMIIIVAAIVLVFIIILLLACICLKRSSNQRKGDKQSASYATTTIVKNEVTESISPPDLWMELNTRDHDVPDNQDAERMPLKQHEDKHYMNSPKPMTMMNMDHRNDSLYTPDSSMMSDPEGSLLRRCPGQPNGGLTSTPTREHAHLGGVAYSNSGYPRPSHAQLGKQYTSTPRINVADINNGLADSEDLRSLPRNSHPLKSFNVPAPPEGPPKHIVKPTPQVTPYKSPSLIKQFSIPEDMMMTKTNSNEELTAEMMNLEGLMQDLSQITEKQFQV